MVRRLLRRTIASFERKWNYDASYLKAIADLSPLAALKFTLATSLGSYRRDVPLAALCAAGITAVRWEDCGPCTQLAITMAERQGVGAEVLRALLQEDAAAMPEEVALAWRFTRATLAHDAAADDYRDEIVRRWGPRAVVTLAFAITTARMYPTVKYAMGHGKICSRVVINGAPLAIDRAQPSGQWPVTSGPSHASRAS
jgi:hypothetical protein